MSVTDAERKLIATVPSADAYDDLLGKAAIEQFHKLSERKQALVLRLLGVSAGTPFGVGANFHQRLLSVIAKVEYGVDANSRGQDGRVITGPLGSGRDR